VRSTVFHLKDPAIHAEAEHAQRNPPALARGRSAWTTGIGVRRTPFCERLWPGGDESESGVTVALHQLGRKGAPRERFVIASDTKCREAIQSKAPLWIASSLALLAMTTA
jgi:hypothetical protein